MLKTISAIISKKKIVYEFNVLTNQIINHLVLICNINQRLNLKIGLNRYFWVNDIGAFEITYNNILSNLETNKYDSAFTELLKIKSKELLNIGYLLTDIHKKILANNLKIEKDKLEIFKFLIDIILIFNQKCNSKFYPKIAVTDSDISLNVFTDCKNKIFRLLENSKQQLADQTNNSSINFSSIFEDARKIMKILENDVETKKYYKELQK